MTSMQAIDDAHDRYREARRKDSGSVMDAREMYVAAIALATAIDGEVTHRLLNHQRTDANDFSFQNVQKLMEKHNPKIL